MSNRKFNIGFISTHGHAAAGHILDLEANGQLDSIHLCVTSDVDGTGMPLDPNVVGEASGKVKTKTRNIDQILDIENLDAVAVCSRPDLAPGIFDRILDAGFPILTDKPAATHSSKLDLVAQKASKLNLAFGTMFQWRRNPAVLDMKHAIDHGALGKIMSVEIRLLASTIDWRDPHKSYLLDKDSMGGGITSWLACHMLDMLIFLLDQRITDVTGFTGNQHTIKVNVEDTAVAAIRLDSGVIGSVHVGYSLCGPSKLGVSDLYLGIRGTNGYLSIHFHMPGQGDLDNTLYLYSDHEEWSTGGQRATSYSNFFKSPQGNGGYGGLMAEKLFSDFLNSSRSGTKSPTPIEDLVHILQVGEAIRESSLSNRAIAIPNN